MIGAEIRARFPIFEHTTYINSCSQGALSVDVREAYESYLAGWDVHGAEWEHWVERAEAARAAFARLVRAEPDEVAVTTSVSQGVSGVVSALPLERGEDGAALSWYTARSRFDTRKPSKAVSVSDNSSRCCLFQRTSRLWKSTSALPRRAYRTSGGRPVERRRTASTRASSSRAENGFTT